MFVRLVPLFFLVAMLRISIPLNYHVNYETKSDSKRLNKLTVIWENGIDVNRNTCAENIKPQLTTCLKHYLTVLT